MLSKLEDVVLPFGFKIEREQYVTGGKVKDYISEEVNNMIGDTEF